MAAQDLNMPSSLPPYYEMICAAIDGLNQKMGSNKTSISAYLEARYGSLPAAHPELLKQHLNLMKERGELIFWKNNYMKPDPNFVRRGRGRPRKPKDGETPAAVAGPTTLAVPFKKETRGRPKKYPMPEDLGVDMGDGSDLALGIGGPRKRGRPPKEKAVEETRFWIFMGFESTITH